MDCFEGFMSGILVGIVLCVVLMFGACDIDEQLINDGYNRCLKDVYEKRITIKKTVKKEDSYIAVTNIRIR